MPINPNIPLMARGFEAPDPLEVMQRITGIRGAQQRQQMQQREIEGAQGAAQVAEKVRAVLSGPRPPTQQEMFSTGIDPKAGLEILKGLEDVQKQGRAGAASFLGSLSAYPDDALRQEAYQEARPALLAKGIPDAELPEQYDPSVSDRFLRSVMSPEKQYEIAHPKVGTRQITTRTPEGGEQVQIVPDEPGQTFTNPAARPTPGTLEFQIWQQYGPNATAEQAEKAKRSWEAAGRAPEKASAGSFEQQIAEALQRGDQATVDRLTKAAELAAGARSRTQGRPVPSGEADDLASFDSSLDDLSVLREAISEPGSTGLIAQLGAKIPWVTQITGWGTDAKKKQALIDRVKQVIGKTLEEGVLRKEDEIKYEKILPTIKDPNEVVISKLDGLDAAIAKRKGRRMDALEDAGYDVSKFKGRTSTVRVKGPNGETGTVPAGTELPAGWSFE